MDNNLFFKTNSGYTTYVELEIKLEDDEKTEE